MKILPESPNLPFLLREAKALKSSHRNGDKNICATIGHFDTSFHGLNEQEILNSRFSILDAQRVVARLYGFSSWSRLKKFVDRSIEGKAPSDIQLRNKVLSRHTELESLMKAYKSKQGDYKGKLDQFQELALDSVHFLSAALDRHGWPGPDVVGPDCVEPLVIVSTNAVYNADFQNESTQLMGESLANGSICARWYATLRDRYLVLSHQPSIYGTTFGAYRDDDGTFKLVDFGVVDRKNLNKRRAQVGYQSMEAERRRLSKQAIDDNWDLDTYEQCMKYFENTSIKGGYQSQ